MSEPPPRIRNFREEDLKTLYEIDRVCFPEDIAFSRAQLAFYLNHPKSIARVADEPGRILGFVLACVETPTCAHVLTLDVLPDARRRKIGTSLMDTLHGKLKRRGIGASILEVGIGNIPAQRLYEKMQYQYLEILYGYYLGREDAYRMARVVC
jgi:ribosomal-protein-alanine N-acetyltransferase